ncbi:MAG: metal ABC transporter ATP-binding protein [Pseudomonadota bacterium]
MSCSNKFISLSTSGLDIGYNNQPALIRNLSFYLTHGDIVAVIGHNGSGKSTFVKTILGIHSAIKGHLMWANHRPHNIAYLGQLTEFDRNFPIQVKDLVAMGAWKSLGFFGTIDEKQQRLIKNALEQTGISDIAKKPIYELSSGQLQRTLFARTIVQNAELILLDEPLTAIDQTTQTHLLDLIDTWAIEKRMVILVMHDVSAALHHCTKALLLGAGKACFGTPREILTPQNLIAHGYMSESQSNWIKQMYQTSPTVEEVL